MKVCYSFLLKPKEDTSFEPWLQNLLEQVENTGASRYTVRVTKEIIDNVKYYRVDNKKNKTYVSIRKFYSNISVELYKKNKPGENNQIKPTYRLIDQMEEKYTDDGVFKLACFIFNLLSEENEYSEKTIVKPIVRNINKQPGDKYFGGMINELYFTETQAQLVFVNGKSFKVPIQTALEKNVTAFKMVVFDNDMNFDVFFQNEFIQYYELVN